ncbi:hypothetical protein DH2020_016443 [Rehmannia glutinosa]|uniref:Uncharacterized protein n=1 Tax=Rehmannia glutinosa TaxID=99300 RepID=A0ABR0WN00_REHGL
MAWRVGNGANIDIEKDRWIGTTNIKRPDMILSRSEEFQKVSDIIDLQSKTWDYNRVKQMFNPHDAERICRTYINPRLLPDKRIWSKEKSGRFTVRSAYHLAVEKWSDTLALASSSTGNPAWKKLWDLRVLPKIKQFLWRVCTDSLPTKDNLRRRGLDIDPVCFICGEGIETSSHIFLKCREVQTIWYTSPLRMDLSITSFESPKNLIWCAMIKYPTDYVEYLACLAWRIWNERNDVYMKEGVFNVERVIRTANKIHGETLSPSPKGTRNGPNHSVPHAWTVPEQGQLKMNCDAAVYKDGSLGYGFVVRDSVGDVLLSGAKRTNMEGSSTLAEGLALIFGLTACRDTGLRQVMIECDCKILIDGLAGKIVPEFYGDLLIKDIRETGEEIGCCSFKHIPREANKQGTHALAHFVQDHETEMFWVEELPPNLESIRVLDVNN